MVAEGIGEAQADAGATPDATVRLSNVDLIATNLLEPGQRRRQPRGPVPVTRGLLLGVAGLLLLRRRSAGGRGFGGRGGRRLRGRRGGRRRGGRGGGWRRRRWGLGAGGGGA